LSPVTRCIRLGSYDPDDPDLDAILVTNFLFEAKLRSYDYILGQGYLGYSYDPSLDLPYDSRRNRNISSNTGVMAKVLAGSYFV